MSILFRLYIIYFMVEKICWAMLDICSQLLTFLTEPVFMCITNVKDKVGLNSGNGNSEEERHVKQY